MGRVRYWLVGPASEQKIVLIRGILTPALAIARLAPILAAASYRVLIYDFYGRGYSNAPQGAYGAHLYIIQLALLLQHLHWSCVRVAGFSMGGAIAAAFVAAFPALVERDVVLIASAGAPEVRPPLLFSKFSHSSFVERQTRRKLSSRVVPVNTPETPMQETVRLQAELLPGYPRAIIASLHGDLFTDVPWAFLVPEWRGRRVLLIQAKCDALVPPAALRTLHRVPESVGTGVSYKGEDGGNLPPPDVSLVSVPGAAHDLTWTHAEEVARVVLEFLGTGQVLHEYESVNVVEA
ncbi:Alpha/Beta hydrolase protein [Mycena leptocephala]|nr:Alpha/Beta hydrolase protein [Mycena leptocephala]